VSIFTLKASPTPDIKENVSLLVSRMFRSGPRVARDSAEWLPGAVGANCERAPERWTQKL